MTEEQKKSKLETVKESSKAATARVTRTPKGDVDYLDAGTGPTILYFHGTGAGNDLALVMEQWLLDDSFRLIIPNRPGYYDTPITCGRSAADCADLAAHLLDTLYLDRVRVIGTSGGGPAACRFAARHPARTAALVLQCAQSHRWDESRWLPEGKQWLFPLLKRRLLKEGVQCAHRWLRRYGWFAPGKYLREVSGPRFGDVRDDPSARELCRLILQATARCIERPAGVDNDLDILLNESPLQPAQVACPTLVLHDPEDPVVPAAHAEWAVACIQGADWCKPRAGGHLIWAGRDARLMHQTRVDFLRQSFAKENTP